MANGHGGLRTPSHPAPVSGPGAFSQRTDGRPKEVSLDNAKYGEEKAFQEIQQGAKLSGPTQASPANMTPPSQPVQTPTPLSAPSQFPNQPVTAGANAGPGPDASSLGLPSQMSEAQDLRQRYGEILPFLIRKADSPYASQEFRDQVRYLVSQIG